jgi:hypothetical protein
MPWVSALAVGRAGLPTFFGPSVAEDAYQIRSGNPVENAHIESFNGRFRDECLNENRFAQMAQARRAIEH